MDLQKIYEAVFISLHVSLLSTFFAFTLSLFFGYFLATNSFFLKKTIVSLFNSLTSIPPVCAGLIVYLLISRSGPLGWMEILYTPSAMIIAHNPGLTNLINQITNISLDNLPTTGLAEIDFSSYNWNNISNDNSTLIDLKFPKQLK